MIPFGSPVLHRRASIESWDLKSQLKHPQSKFPVSPSLLACMCRIWFLNMWIDFKKPKRHRSAATATAAPTGEAERQRQIRKSATHSRGAKSGGSQIPATDLELGHPDHRRLATNKRPLKLRNGSKNKRHDVAYVSSLPVDR